MVEAIRALTTASTFMDNPAFTITEPVRCLYVEAENGEQTTVERFKKAFEHEDTGIWKDNFYLASKNLNLHFNDSTGVRNLAAMVKDVEPRVLLLDPISFMFHKDENSNSEVGQLYYAIAKLKELVPDMSIILSHHFGKRPYGKNAEDWDPLSEYNFRGASKWKDGGDTLITMQRRAHIRTEPDEAWELRMRFLTRHGSSPPEGDYTFNRAGDLRVRYEGKHETSLRKLKVKPESTAKTHETVFDFRPGDQGLLFEKG